jgi:nitrate/nitrite transport system permease protein
MTLLSIAAGARRSASLNRLIKALTSAEVVLPIAGFAGLLAVWWLIATLRSEIMPTPWQALTENIDFILHPFYRRGPGDLGIG